MPPASVPTPIAFCITELDRGGAERALTRLALGLDRSRWQPRVYCLGPRGCFADELEAGGVTVECFGGRGMLSAPIVLIRLTRALRRFRPAILQTFLFHANFLGRLAGRMARVPRIVSGIRVAERRCRWHVSLDYWTNWLVDHNVCVSQGVADFASNVMRLRRDKLSVIPNGVDYQRFATASSADLRSLGIPDGSRVIISVARLDEQKGIAFLLEAAETVCQDDPNAHFLIAGDGPDRARLTAIAEQRGVTNNVHFVGNRDDVSNMLAASDLFVLPSLWEGMPNALLEAMAAGLPVIATDVEGSRELIESGVNGLLVPAASPVPLAAAIRSILGNVQFGATLARASQNTIEKRFTEESVVSAYDELYRSLLMRC
jgi:glycosyltransferase involved in cell wall biosynthesis